MLGGCRDTMPRNHPTFPHTTVATRSTGMYQVHKCQQGEHEILLYTCS